MDVPNVPHIVEDRRMMSRTVTNQLQIVGKNVMGRWPISCTYGWLGLPDHGEMEHGCLVCMNGFSTFFILDLFSFSLNLCLLAPEMAPCFAQCICCTFPKYILDQIEASKYIILRENSMGLWNQFSLFFDDSLFFPTFRMECPRDDQRRGDVVWPIPVFV